MSYINFNNNAQSGFQNALAMGMQMGAQAREANERKEYRNALATVIGPQSDVPGPQEGGDVSPAPDRGAAMAVLAERNPQLYMQLQEREQAQARAQRESQLTEAALSDDPAVRTPAMRQLAVQNFDRWKALDSQQREAIQQEAEVHANAAMDVLRLPPEQRAGAVMAFANRLQSSEIAQLADLPPQELEAALRAAIAEAGMVKELHAMERPDYMVIPEGGVAVDRRNAEALAQFAPGAQGGGQQPISKPLSNGTIAYQNPETGEWFDNPQEAMGGGASNGIGGFPGN